MGSKYTAEEKALLSQYVTDLEGDVYCIYNLPEEVIAVIFAYVSRSPKSFRDNLLQLLRSGDLDLMTLPGTDASRRIADGEPEWTPAVERARKFHERYTVGYGHASVAEHAVVRVGVEKVSRFVSGLLETANPFLSFTEYSQRYQRPQRGAYVVPPELEGHPQDKQRYIAFQERCFDVYEALLAGLHRYLLDNEPVDPGEPELARRRRLEKWAFEDARYALSLATHTNLGMTGNARAVRDALVVLLSQPWPESQRLAEAMKAQVQRLVPTLLRYADPNPYRMAAAAAGATLAADLGLVPGPLDQLPPQHPEGDGTGTEAGVSGSGGDGPWAAGSLPDPGDGPDAGHEVRLLDWTGRGASGQGDGDAEDSEAYALDVFLAGMALGSAPAGADSRELQRRLADWPLERKRQWVRDILSRLGPHDNPPGATHRIRYSVEFSVSEANWHQLLRHCRRIDFTASHPQSRGALTVPPRIAQAGLAGPLLRLGEEAQRLGEDLGRRFPGVAPYLVLNAHRRRVFAEFNLWELYHLVNLRSSPEAQWDIRETVLSLHREVAKVHPTLVVGAMRRLGRPEQALYSGR